MHHSVHTDDFEMTIDTTPAVQQPVREEVEEIYRGEREECNEDCGSS
jgi:hypothetical protein